jgi:hypothetical protein
LEDVVFSNGSSLSLIQSLNSSLVMSHVNIESVETNVVLNYFHSTGVLILDSLNFTSLNVSAIIFADASQISLSNITFYLVQIATGSISLEGNSISVQDMLFDSIQKTSPVNITLISLIANEVIFSDVILLRASIDVFLNIITQSNLTLDRVQVINGVIYELFIIETYQNWSYLHISNCFVGDLDLEYVLRPDNFDGVTISNFSMNFTSVYQSFIRNLNANTFLLTDSEFVNSHFLEMMHVNSAQVKYVSVRNTVFAGCTIRGSAGLAGLGYKGLFGSQAYELEFYFSNVTSTNCLACKLKH